MKARTQRKTLPALPRTTCSALVTRYPTGCFGIDYNGSMFHWWGFVEADVHAELERLRIPAKRVKWEERYYDRRYDFNDPRSYKTRKFIPQNAERIRVDGKPMTKHCDCAGRQLMTNQCPTCRAIERTAKDRLTRSSREWRSAAFWHSDIEDVMDRIANEAMEYHPDSRAEFFHDVMAAIKDHLENNQARQRD